MSIDIQTSALASFPLDDPHICMCMHIVVYRMAKQGHAKKRVKNTHLMLHPHRPTPSHSTACAHTHTHTHHAHTIEAELYVTDGTVFYGSGIEEGGDCYELRVQSTDPNTHTRTHAHTHTNANTHTHRHTHTRTRVSPVLGSGQARGCRSRCGRPHVRRRSLYWGRPWTRWRRLP